MEECEEVGNNGYRENDYRCFGKKFSSDITDDGPLAQQEANILNEFWIVADRHGFS